MWYAACAPSTSTTAPAACAARDDLGHRVDRAERVRDVAHGDDLRARPEQPLGTRPGRARRGRRSARPSAARRCARTSICQGTMFEWCSMAEISTSSPADRFAPPQLCATRLMPSVASAVKTISCGCAGVEERRDLVARALVGRRRALGQQVHAAVDVGVRGLVVVRDRRRSPRAASGWWRRCRDRPAACRGPLRQDRELVRAASATASGVTAAREARQRCRSWPSCRIPMPGAARAG